MSWSPKALQFKRQVVAVLQTHKYKNNVFLTRGFIFANQKMIHNYLPHSSTELEVILGTVSVRALRTR